MMIMTVLESILVPVSICVVLPVLIVWIVGRVRQNEVNRRAEIMLKAIENGASIDPELLKPHKKASSIKKDLLEKLNGACIIGLMGIAFLLCHLFFPDAVKGFMSPRVLPFVGSVFLAVGIGLLISYFTGRKLLSKEIESEEKKLLEQ